MKIEGFLKGFGIALVIIGIIGGIAGWVSIDHDEYDTAKQVYEELYDNEFAEASYNTAKSTWLSQVGMVIGAALGSVIGGLVLLGLSKMIELQQNIYRNLSDRIYKEDRVS